MLIFFGFCSEPRMISTTVLKYEIVVAQRRLIDAMWPLGYPVLLG